MTLDQLIDYALTKPGVEQSMPFGPDVLVLKITGKMFLLIPLDADLARFNAKCDPQRAEELREAYEGIQPGYHMNKRHWNTIFLNTSVPSMLIREMVDHSYDLVGSLVTKSKK